MYLPCAIDTAVSRGPHLVWYRTWNLLQKKQHWHGRPNAPSWFSNCAPSHWADCDPSAWRWCLSAETLGLPPTCDLDKNIPSENRSESSELPMNVHDTVDDGDFCMWWDDRGQETARRVAEVTSQGSTFELLELLIASETVGKRFWQAAVNCQLM